MKDLNEIIGRLPSPLKGAILSIAGDIRTRLFNVPDPMKDFARLVRLTGAPSILDIGAHHGQTALRIVDLLDEGQVYCFEPFQASYAQLTEATSRIDRITTFNFALSDTDGSIEFNSNLNSQTNSMLRNDVDNIVNVPSSNTVETLTIPSRSLDRFSLEAFPDGQLCIKADVQGAELYLIEGAKKTLRERTKVFLCEASLARLYKKQADLFTINEVLCNELGFELYQIYRTRSDKNGRALWCDAIWVKKDFFADL